MFLGVQYYRPPFPNRKYWADDLARIRDAGLHAVQLWAVWGWIEAEPGAFRYEDYDELMGLAQQRGLKVVISTIAEIHPFWIHRVVPGSEMIDHVGNKVVSSCRNEVSQGLTPGGCFDHPKVLELMGNFLTDIAARYTRARHLLAWDCWNELRWNVQSDGYVCYCPSTIARFHRWLDQRHGGLDGLNRAWNRRYAAWADVRPGKMPGRPYTEMMEFTRFLEERAGRHMGFRHQAIRAGDPSRRLISAHGGAPCTWGGGGGFEHPINRGNDWGHADQLDGYGCSHFPFWGEGFDEEGFGLRVETTRSANQGKVVWVSELQGGSARDSIVAHRSVPAGPQQRWIYNGMARGAKGVIFWCWRDEVFGRESSGFGLAGWDRLAPRRLAAMRQTGAWIDRYNGLIEAYRPAPARVGLLFVPHAFHLRFADSGSGADGPSEALMGYGQALERMHIPYEMVECDHLAPLKQLDVLLMPWPLVLPERAAAAILAFVRRGGRILIEAECDSFTPLGFYRYPDERPFMQALGLHDLGRRKLAPAGDAPASGKPAPPAIVPAELDAQSVDLAIHGFTTPLAAPGAEVLAVDEQGQPLLVRRRVGKGAAFVLGSFAGQPYARRQSSSLERLIQHVCRDAGYQNDFEVTAEGGGSNARTGVGFPGAGAIQWRTGLSGRKRLLWIINSGDSRLATVVDNAGKFGRARTARELVSGRAVAVTASGAKAGNAGGKKQCQVELPAGGACVLMW